MDDNVYADDNYYKNQRQSTCITKVIYRKMMNNKDKRYQMVNEEIIITLNKQTTFEKTKKLKIIKYYKQKVSAVVENASMWRKKATVIVSL